MSDARLKRQLVRWMAQLNRPVMDALSEIIWVHESLGTPGAYWPQMRGLIRDMCTEL